MNTKIKKWFFKTCPKSGRIVGINKKNVVLKICFPLFGLAALIWFLIRVVPKPSRIEYPCQQIAAPIAFSFVAFISSTLVGYSWWYVQMFFEAFMFMLMLLQDLIMVVTL